MRGPYRAKPFPGSAESGGSGVIMLHIYPDMKTNINKKTFLNLTPGS
jgi:hypothetical protein